MPPTKLLEGPWPPWPSLSRPPCSTQSTVMKIASNCLIHRLLDTIAVRMPMLKVVLAVAKHRDRIFRGANYTLLSCYHVTCMLATTMDVLATYREYSTLYSTTTIRKKLEFAKCRAQRTALHGLLA